jgi:hypothetical protein
MEVEKITNRYDAMEDKSCELGTFNIEDSWTLHERFSPAWTEVPV